MQSMCLGTPASGIGEPWGGKLENEMLSGKACRGPVTTAVAQEAQGQEHWEWSPRGV